MVARAARQVISGAVALEAVIAVAAINIVGSTAAVDLVSERVARDVVGVGGADDVVDGSRVLNRQLKLAGRERLLRRIGEPKCDAVGEVGEVEGVDSLTCGFGNRVRPQVSAATKEKR